MDKVSANPISLIGDLCLIAFLLPGRLDSWTATNGYHIVLGIIQPGWMGLVVNPPQYSSLQAGLHFDISLSYIFLFVFIVTKLMTSRQDRKDGGWRDEYLRTTRRPRY